MSIESKLEQVDRDIEALLANKEELKKQLEAEKKPKLRHGDYGYYGPHPRLMVENAARILKGVNDEYIYGERYLPDVILGNIFDDLKAMQEGVEEIEIKCCANEDSEFVIRQHHLVSDEIVFQVGCGSIAIKKHDFPTFRNKVNQMYATLKRKEQK